MPRILPPAIVLALMLGFANSTSAQERFATVYATSVAEACHLSFEEIDLNPTSQPVLPVIDIPVLGTVTLDLCFIVLPLATSNGEEAVCNNGTGTESCAEQVLFTAPAGEIEIMAFAEAGFPLLPLTDPPSFPNYAQNLTATTLKIAGGHPLTGLNGSEDGSGLQGLRWGSVTLKGLAEGGTFQIDGSFGGYVNASMQTVNFPTTDVASTIRVCGNGILDPPPAVEDCDDDNVIFGDGCSPNCRLESLLEVTGQVGTVGSLDVTIGSVLETFDLSGMAGNLAAEVVEAIKLRFNPDQPFLIADQVDEFGTRTTDGQRLVADQLITATLSGSNGSLVAVPEPGHLVMLAAGIALLLGLERRRSGRERLR